MTTQDKRFPALSDDDLMMFGKHKGEPLVDVPAKYLVWLWREMFDEYGRSNMWREEMPDWMKDKAALANYIWNCKQVLEQETDEIL